MGDKDEVVGVGNLSGPLKGVLLLLSILAIVIPPTAAFVILAGRVETNSGSIEEQKADEEKRWENSDKRTEKLESSIGEVKDDVHLMELNQERQSTQNAEILRRLERIDGKLDKWEPAGD